MIIAIGGLKGGSGKSTIATCLAAEWTQRGQRVLLVDADPQGTSSTWGTVAAETGRDTPTVVAMGEGLHKPEQLPRVAEAFDVTVVDCPPRHDKIQRAALAVADLVVLPCSPSVADVWALAESVDLVEKVQTLRPELGAVFLINRKVARSVIGAEVRTALGDYELPILQTELGARVDYSMALGVGLGASQYRSGAASAEVRMLADELEEIGGEHE